MNLNNAQYQLQTVSPQLIQTMEVLQMNALELKAYLENIALENPLIDLDETALLGDGVPMRREMEWLKNASRGYDRQLTNPPGAASDDEPLDNNDPHYQPEESLSFFLKAQLYSLRLPEQLETAVEWIISNLDEKGWFDDRLTTCRFSGTVLTEALQVVQGMDPAGVGAANLADCLQLQLRRLHGDQTVAIRIAEKYLEELAKNHYHLIATELGVSQAKVRLACDDIKRLNPHPNAGFSRFEPVEYILPDIIVTDLGDRFEVALVEQDIPSLRLNDYYCRLMRESTDTHVLEYLDGKARQAKWLLQSLGQRKKTILNCAEAMLELQQAFFRTGKKLAPMTLGDVASIVNVHESTVSRAIRSKYVQCSYGVFPVSSLFSRHKGDSPSIPLPDVKRYLCRLVETENKKKPLSDQELSELLACDDLKLSRRTVAKYRMDLNIPPAMGRRKI